MRDREKCFAVHKAQTLRKSKHRYGMKQREFRRKGRLSQKKSWADFEAARERGE